MEEFSQFIKVLDGYVWGPVMMALILGTGLYLTFGLRFLPWTRLDASPGKDAPRTTTYMENFPRFRLS